MQVPEFLRQWWRNLPRNGRLYTPSGGVVKGLYSPKRGVSYDGGKTWHSTEGTGWDKAKTDCT